VKTLQVLFVLLLASLPLHAEWKVATVKMNELFNKNPLTVAFGEESNKQLKAIDEDPRNKAALAKKEERDAIDREGQQLVSAYQNLTVRDEEGEEHREDQRCRC
jgi:hypothetical protein